MADVSGRAVGAWFATEHAEERIVEILLDHYSDELTERFGRNDLQLSSDGFYLPDPKAYYRTLPRPDTPKNAANVTVFVGQVTSSEYPASGNTNRTSTAAGIGWAAEVKIPMAAMVVFSMASQDPIADPLAGSSAEGGRELTQEEVMRRRAQRYLGALKSCLSRWTYQEAGATYGPGVTTIWPRADFVDVEALRVGAEKQSQLWAVAYYEFDIEQFQAFPQHGA